MGSSAIRGGQPVLATIPRSALDWINLIRLGIPASAIDALTRLTHLSRSELAAAVAIGAGRVGWDHQAFCVSANTSPRIVMGITTARRHSVSVLKT